MSTRNVSAKHGRYYGHEMTDADHLDLLSALRSVNGMVVLSGYPSRAYDEALRGWAKTTTSARISAARGSGVRSECLWLNPRCARELDGAGLFSEIA